MLLLLWFHYIHVYDNLLVIKIVLIFFIIGITIISSMGLYFVYMLTNEDIAQNTDSGVRKSNAQSTVDYEDYERVSKIQRLRSQGLITEEEYQQAVSKEQ